MKEIGMLFSGEMVQAILDERIPQPSLSIRIFQMA